MVDWQLYCFTRLRAGEARHAFEPRQLPSKPCRPRRYLYFSTSGMRPAGGRGWPTEKATSQQKPRSKVPLLVRNACPECLLTPSEAVSIILQMADRASKERQKSLERALEEAVSRAVRDNLAPLQRTAEDLQHAYSDLVAACSSSRPTNALPAMLRAQTAAAALAAGLSVLSNFVTVALNPREYYADEEEPEPTPSDSAGPAAVAVAEGEKEARPATPATEPVTVEPEWAEEPVAPPIEQPSAVSEVPAGQGIDQAGDGHDALAEEPPIPVAAAEVAAEETVAEKSGVFDLASLPPEVQDLHRRANRVAKVAMQDIKLLRPGDVRLGCEYKDICHRLRTDLDKARKEYDRRFRAILDDPIDYFHHWMVEILAGGDPGALGEYPYPSPLLRN